MKTVAPITSQPTVCAQVCEMDSDQGVHMPPQRDGQLQPLSKFINDPSAGSPTETLLRLLLPLNDQV